MEAKDFQGGNMIVQHNIAAMNAGRMLLYTNKKKEKVIEKLSSGYRINRAADDAAGLSISEKMRRQIRGLAQAARNAQDGISMVQIADGAMAEVHDMLHRGTELSIKAANGTLTDEDRKYIQQEIEQLKDEIDCIAERTTFNERPILKGKGFPDAEIDSEVIITGNMPDWVAMGSTSNMNEEYVTQERYEITNPDGSTTTELVNIPHEAATIDFSSFTGAQDQLDELVGNGFYTTCCTCTNHYSIKFTMETTNTMETSGNHYIYNIGIGDVTDADELLKRIIQGTNNGYPRHHYTKMAADTANSKLIIYDDRSNSANPKDADPNQGHWKDWNNPQFGVVASGGYGKFGPGTAYSVDDAGKLEPLVSIALLVGADAEEAQFLKIDLPAISCMNVGVKTVDVSTIEGAKSAIKAFKKGIEYVSGERSRMGAYQNRLEHTINNLNNVVENTQAAESAIRDTDMAALMVMYSNNNILAQAGQAILAQTEQSNQGVLQLLQ